MNFEETYKNAELLTQEPLKMNDSYFSKAVLMARYWNTNKKSKKYITDELFKRIRPLYAEFPVSAVEGQIKNILHIAKVKGDFYRKEINFSVQELEFIKSFDNEELERILFVMFCSYKKSLDGTFAFGAKEMTTAAKMSYSAYKLESYISYIVNNEIFHINPDTSPETFLPYESTYDLFCPHNIVLSISNYENLAYYYLNYKGEGQYLTCRNCGAIEKRRSNAQVLCRRCNRNKNIIPEELKCYKCGDKFMKYPNSQRIICSNCYEEERSTRENKPTKTIQCTNCTKEFIVDGDSKRVLCNECYRIERGYSKPPVIEKCAKCKKEYIKRGTTKRDVCDFCYEEERNTRFVVPPQIISCSNCNRDFIAEGNTKRDLCDYCYHKERSTRENKPTKTIQCTNCTKEFVVDGDSKRELCDECYEIERKKIINENAKRYYHSKKNA